MEDKCWFIPRNRDISSYKVRLNSRADSRQSFRVKYCNKCHKSHETAWEDCKSVTRYYDDFVTYGLERSVCERGNQSP